MLIQPFKDPYAIHHSDFGSEEGLMKKTSDGYDIAVADEDYLTPQTAESLYQPLLPTPEEGKYLSFDGQNFIWSDCQGGIGEEADPVFSSWLAGVEPQNWDEAYSWGDHSGLYLPIDGKAADSDKLDGYDSSHFQPAGDYALSSHNHSGVYEPVISSGTTAQYYRGDKTWQTLNQAAVSGLTAASSPTFAGLTLGTGTALTLGSYSANTKILCKANNNTGRGSFRIQFEEASNSAGGYIDYDSNLNRLYFGGIDNGGVDRDGFYITRDTGAAVFLSDIDISSYNFSALTATIGGRVNCKIFKSEDALNAYTTLYDETKYLAAIHNASTTAGHGAGLAFTVAGASSTTNVGAAIIANRTGGNGKAKLEFYTKQSDSTPVNPSLVLTLGDDGYGYFANRLRIGSSSAPSEVLDITGNAKLSGQIISTLAVGTKPLDVTSTTVCTNLNADLLDGEHASAFASSAHNHNSDYSPLSFKNTLDSVTGLIKCNGSGSYSGVADYSSNWNAAYDWGNHALAGYESASNKKTTLEDNSDTYYPTQKCVKTALKLYHTIAFQFDNGENVIPDGSIVEIVDFPFDCTITQWSIEGDAEGSITIDVRKTDWSGSPPTDEDSIVDEYGIYLDGETKRQSSDLSEWASASISAGDTVQFVVIGDAADITRASVSLKVQRV